MHSFAFESYGVRICIKSPQKRVIERGAAVACNAVVGRYIEIDPLRAEHIFTIAKKNGDFYLTQGGKPIEFTAENRASYHYFDALIRFTVGEFAEGYVFVHAGAVGWKGKALLFPAGSYSGKSTLVAELVRLGAEYYSDDFAVIDENGQVHPFPRPISIRNPSRGIVPTSITAESLGGQIGTQALPIGLLLLTHYKERAVWRPRLISPGEAVLAMITHTLPIRINTEFSLRVLKRAINRAIIMSTARNDAKVTAGKIIEFVDKSVF